MHAWVAARPDRATENRPGYPRERSMIVRPAAGALTIALLAMLVAASPAQADPISDFYHGKTVNLVVGTSPGNDYDFRGRLIARHMGRHIPGEPTIASQNMPGAGGIKAANYMASIAPKDGTTVHMIMTNMMATQAMHLSGVEFDTRQFRWIGNTTSTPNVINSWHTSGITNIEQVKTKELVVGAPNRTAGVIYPTLLNKLAGMKFRIVTGYPGGNEVNIAMERGEVLGRGSNSWASWKSTKPQWLSEKKIFILVQVGLKRDSDLADVPLLIELASNDRDRKLMTFVSAETAISRALVTTPGVPPERVEALRRAFDATMKDPQFLADANKAQMDISPMTGEESQIIADQIANTPADIVAYAHEILGDLLR
jgi:tripartite-type tricarboxylate transporter receptor subunit TctC